MFRNNRLMFFSDSSLNGQGLPLPVDISSQALLKINGETESGGLSSFLLKGILRAQADPAPCDVQKLGAWVEGLLPPCVPQHVLMFLGPHTWPLTTTCGPEHLKCVQWRQCSVTKDSGDLV